MNVLTRGENVELEPKDFFHSSTELVHRDLNFYKDCEAVTVNILVGLGPSVVNVPAPSIVN